MSEDIHDQLERLYVKFHLGTIYRNPCILGTPQQLADMLSSWKTSGMSEETKLLFTLYRPKNSKNKKIVFTAITDRLGELTKSQLEEYKKELNEIISKMPKSLPWSERNRSADTIKTDPLFEVFNTLTVEQVRKLNEDIANWDES